MAPRQAEPIHLEGTTLEGGGQLLRIALGLSSLTAKPVRITNIRGRRSGGGGLKAQHLTSLSWLGQASNARISGAGLKSKEITFAPNRLPPTHSKIVAEHISISQSTPGSINLVFQAVLPHLLFSGAQGPIHLRVMGGTNVSTSPSYDYVEQVLLPMLSIIGIPTIRVTCNARGWSTGSTRIGSATFTITPLTTALPAFQLTERGSITSVRATIIAPKDTEEDFRDILDLMFERRLSRIFGDAKDPAIEITFEDSGHEKRYYLLLVVTTSTGLKLGRDWLYDGGVRNGKTGHIIPNIVRKVSDDLLAEIEHGGCVDEWMRDQLVTFQSLAQGTSRVDGGRKEGRLLEPSLHTKTAMWVAQKMVDAEFDETGGCKGVALEPGGRQGGNILTEGIETLQLTE
ncbi:RNA 3'-terminal phosphate cyclase domain-containing protein [Boeremia exigua]|uniref:RNA 3'-terminal phosphate cyclase domain-containing protein n=1 Tax=Boeremia exigua TaxID=749465 RepID=UPI001E8E8A9C|nr:RNA 3'-terminal phosphate cyclase domain-containing protein [Boeremia exigua]KAH6643782.1 RNA 3'-terminal phosphate cyclase domain-containing protein [Boeremia exigua]